jgi:hypothetical protein
MKKKLLFLSLSLLAVVGALSVGVRPAEAANCGYNVCTSGPAETCCDWCCLDDNGKILYCSDRPSYCF